MQNLTEAEVAAWEAEIAEKERLEDGLWPPLWSPDWIKEHSVACGGCRAVGLVLWSVPFPESDPRKWNYIRCKNCCPPTHKVR